MSLFRGDLTERIFGHCKIHSSVATRKKRFFWRVENSLLLDDQKDRFFEERENSLFHGDLKETFFGERKCRYFETT